MDAEIDLLCALVARAGQIVSKDELIERAWEGVAVTDNSLEQAISSLRRTLDAAAPRRYIETEARRGYRFVEPVRRSERRETDDAIDALLAPHRAWIEGRAALESLERTQILRAREVFARVIGVAPAQASAHVGLANACVLQFEMTRADRTPDVEALAAAAHHAREACRLDPDEGEGWATLGFVLERTGDRRDALAALRRAVALEPDNWRHHLRLSYGGWGEERLRAARRTLALLPGFALAHWLAASVHVVRLALGDAGREIAAGLVRPPQPAAPHARFSAVALNWLSGLLKLRAGDDEGALADFDRELAAESSGHLYAREVCANTSYAVGALHLRRHRLDEAGAAFGRALDRVERHPLALVGLAHVRGVQSRLAGAAALAAGDAVGATPPSEEVMARAALLTLNGRPAEAAALALRWLDDAEPGPIGWLLPLESAATNRGAAGPLGAGAREAACPRGLTSQRISRRLSLPQCPSLSFRCGHDPAVDFAREHVDASRQLLNVLGQLGVGREQLVQSRRLLCGNLQALLVRARQVLAMLSVGVGVHLVAVGLAGLGKQDERSGICGLKAEREIEQDERVDVEMHVPHRVDSDPRDDDNGLPDQEARRAEVAGEGFRGLPEPARSKGAVQMKMGAVEAVVVGKPVCHRA